MPRYDFIVVGAGPAGASFAYYAGIAGYRVAVYDMAPRPALKPCGWLVPREVERYLRVPEELVVQRVRGYRVYLDGKLLGEEYGVDLGYHINKPAFIKWLLENADRFFNKYFDHNSHHDGSRVVYAGGGYRVHGDRILAIQAVYRLSETVDPEVVEIWFDRSLVGYYWFFPETERTAKIGVGGFASYTELHRRLHAFAKTKRAEATTPVQGAWINVSGVKPDLLRADTPVIGEAAGFVFPLSGEGIRPSIASAKAAFDYIARGHDPSSTIGGLASWINRQKKLLDIIRKGGPDTRAAVLASLPPRLAVKIAMGTATTRELLAQIIRSPGRVARILKLLVGERNV